MSGYRLNYRKQLDARFDFGAQWPDLPCDGPIHGVDAALDAFDRFVDAGLYTWLSLRIVLRGGPVNGPSGTEDDDMSVTVGSEGGGAPEESERWASVLFAPAMTQTKGWSGIEQTTLQALGCPSSLLVSEAASSGGFSMTVRPPVSEGIEPPARAVVVRGPAGWGRASNLRRLLDTLSGRVLSGRVTVEAPLRHRNVVAAELLEGRLGAVATGGWVGFYAYGLRDVTAAGALAEGEEAYRFGSVGVRGHRVAVDLIVARGADGEPTYRLSAETGPDGPDAVAVLTEDWGALGPAERW